MVLVLAALALSGCAGIDPAPEPALRCGSAAVLKTRGWPEGGGEWCETTGGVRDGAVRLRARGFRVEGSYRNDHAAGRWSAWWPSGRRAGELDFADGMPHGRLVAWYEDGRPLASGAFEAGRVSTAVTFFDARGRGRYRLDPETVGVMDGHAFDERGDEVTPDADWLPKVLPKAYELLLAVVTLSGQPVR
jgi:hypothetical protein